ncbi:MAG: SEC-C domain-containing protein [Planctomycetota bacterium]
MDLFSNMPCSCGSSLRYADCCGQPEAGSENAYDEIQAVIEGLTGQMLPYVFNDLGPMRATWCQLTGHRDLPPPEWPDFNFFVQWYVWHLQLAFVDEDGTQSVETHARGYSRLVSDEATATELRILENSEQSTLSFWRVNSVGPGGWMVVCDEFVQTETKILNPKDAGQVEPGDVFVGSIVHAGEFSMPLTRAQRFIEPRLQKIMGAYLHLADWMRNDGGQLPLDLPKPMRRTPDWMN